MSLVVHQLDYIHFAISAGHSPGEKTSTKPSSRLKSLLFCEETIAEETESWLEASWGTATLALIVSHHYQPALVGIQWNIPARYMQ